MLSYQQLTSLYDAGFPANIAQAAYSCMWVHPSGRRAALEDIASQPQSSAIWLAEPSIEHFLMALGKRYSLLFADGMFQVSYSASRSDVRIVSSFGTASEALCHAFITMPKSRQKS